MDEHFGQPMGGGGGGPGRGAAQGGKARPEYIRQPKVSQVKNRSAAPVQITAEQLLREAKDRIEAEPKETVQKIQDADELASYRYAVAINGEFADLIFFLLLL